MNASNNRWMHWHDPTAKPPRSEVVARRPAAPSEVRGVPDQSTTSVHHCGAFTERAGASPVMRSASDRSNLEAMALLRPDRQPVPSTFNPQIKRGVARTAHPMRIASGPVIHRRTEMGGGCCQFGWVDSGEISLKAMPYRRTASSWPLD